jgi:LAO/AO transport system kinase
MVDMFVLLQAPGGGDELQGIKRGIMEMADLVVVTKADGALAAAAQRAASDYQAALHLLRPRTPHWHPRVVLASAVTGQGIDTVWGMVSEFRAVMEASGALAAERAAQARAWMWSEIEAGLIAALEADADIRAAIATCEQEVTTGRLAPALAARRVLDLFHRHSGKEAADGPAA